MSGFEKDVFLVRIRTDPFDWKKDNLGARRVHEPLPWRIIPLGGSADRPAPTRVSRGRVRKAFAFPFDWKGLKGRPVDSKGNLGGGEKTWHEPTSEVARKGREQLQAIKPSSKQNWKSERKQRPRKGCNLLLEAAESATKPNTHARCPQPEEPQAR